MAATLQRKSSGGINFVIITKIITVRPNGITDREQLFSN